jgi:hypothetical protein
MAYKYKNKKTNNNENIIEGSIDKTQQNNNDKDS